MSINLKVLIKIYNNSDYNAKGCNRNCIKIVIDYRYVNKIQFETRPLEKYATHIFLSPLHKSCKITRQTCMQRLNFIIQKIFCLFSFYVVNAVL